MRFSFVIATVGVAMALGACDQRPLAGPEVQPLVLGAAPAGQTQPLIFVDGRRVSFTSLQQLTSSMIQSVEVIKGAAAARLYGEAGRNGVILIRTKSEGGKE